MCGVTIDRGHDFITLPCSRSLGDFLVIQSSAIGIGVGWGVLRGLNGSSLGLEKQLAGNFLIIAGSLELPENIFRQHLGDLPLSF